MNDNVSCFHSVDITVHLWIPIILCSWIHHFNALLKLMAVFLNVLEHVISTSAAMHFTYTRVRAIPTELPMIL